MAILISLLKMVMEVVAHELASIFTAPDAVLDDPTPALDSLDVDGLDRPDLTGKYDGLLAG